MYTFTKTRTTRTLKKKQKSKSRLSQSKTKLKSPIRKTLESDQSSWAIDSPQTPDIPASPSTPNDKFDAELLQNRKVDPHGRIFKSEASLNLFDTEKWREIPPTSTSIRPVQSDPMNDDYLGGDDIIFLDPQDYKEVQTDEEPAEIISYSNDLSDQSFLFQMKLPLFADGIRTVDFVLVWQQRDSRACTQESFKKRRIFETNLSLEGFQLEYENPLRSGLTFIKLHATLEVLRRYCEILKIRMPMKKIPGLKSVETIPSLLLLKKNKGFIKFMKFLRVANILFPPTDQKYTAVYSRDREYLFDVTSPEFFGPAIRARIINFILDRKFFTENHTNVNSFGILRLINDHVYVAAYPLHDGDLATPDTWRYTLYREWAEVKNMFHTQPLDPIREYFGVKIALYFAWLQFYTLMLIPASIMGILCFIYGCATVFTDVPSNEICNANEDVKMCPRCDRLCDYATLKDSCLFSKLTYLFDNPSTVFFAMFMSCWAAIFLEFWKRYSAEITHRWDLTSYDYQEEHPRPQYLARLKKAKQYKMNTVTHTWEPKVSFWKYYLPARIFTFSVILLLVGVGLATVFGVILYRMSTFVALSMYPKTKNTSTMHALLFVSVTGATINLLFVLVFNMIYGYIAEYLTEIEYLRTATEFDESVTVKLYMLQFVNNYSSIFYIAFIKGLYVGYPGSYNRIFSFRQEECNPAGCLCELSIQLFIMMIGKQIWTTLMEMIVPLFYKLYYSSQLKHGKRSISIQGSAQWVKDYRLMTWTNLDIYNEYLEMVIQYGFVTIFVAAFPIAPLCALINNAFEIRMDAQKLLIFYRRPLSERVRDIGIWFQILDIIGQISILSNAFIIAFTSSFIPKLFYSILISPDNSLAGYLNFSLAYFNTSEFEDQYKPYRPSNVSICRYPDFREPPKSSNKYKFNPSFWHLLTAKLAFVLVFQNFVGFLTAVCRWLIPSVSSELRNIIRREAFITNEIIIKQEALRAVGITPPDNIVLQRGRSVVPKKMTPLLSTWTTWKRFFTRNN